MSYHVSWLEIGLWANLKQKSRVFLNITKSKQIKFLFISFSDLYGGGSIAGYRLHKALLNNGYISMMVVNRKLSNDD